tara:strand:- start:139 stop:348 length:210 start_codon:yes stop_codon:yes gene_type:complete
MVVKMSLKVRKILSLIILLLGLPIYIILSVSALNLLDRPSLMVELCVYVVLGIIWALPFKFIFKGVGKG